MRRGGSRPGRRCRLSKAGLEQALRWANELAGREFSSVYCGDEPTSRQTGRALAEMAEVRLRPMEDLQEVDVGLWEGLTDSQIEARFPKLHRCWVTDPVSVCPPQGEPVKEAASRLDKAVRTIARKHKGGTVAVILGPIALAVVRSQLGDEAPEGLHGLRSDRPVWYRLGDAARKQQASAASNAR